MIDNQGPTPIKRSLFSSLSCQLSLRDTANDEGCAFVVLNTTSLACVELYPPWHSCLAPIEGRSSQPTLPGRSRISFEGYGTSPQTQEWVINVRVEEIVLLTLCLQVDEELGRQMAQMKLIVQGTPGSSALHPVPQARIKTIPRSRMQPRASTTAGTMHYTRRPPIRPGEKRTNAAIRSTKGCPDHILSYPSMEARQRTIERIGDCILVFKATRDYCGIMSRLRISRECTSMRDYPAASDYAGQHCGHHPL
jgi:hypothetical protein